MNITPPDEANTPDNNTNLLQLSEMQANACRALYQELCLDPSRVVDDFGFEEDEVLEIILAIVRSMDGDTVIDLAQDGCHELVRSLQTVSDRNRWDYIDPENQVWMAMSAKYPEFPNIPRNLPGRYRGQRLQYVPRGHKSGRVQMDAHYNDSDFHNPDHVTGDGERYRQRVVYGDIILGDVPGLIDMDQETLLARYPFRYQIAQLYAGLGVYDPGTAGHFEEILTACYGQGRELTSIVGDIEEGSDYPYFRFVSQPAPESNDEGWFDPERFERARDQFVVEFLEHERSIYDLTSFSNFVNFLFQPEMAGSLQQAGEIANRLLDSLEHTNDPFYDNNHDLISRFLEGICSIDGLEYGSVRTRLGAAQKRSVGV